MAAGRLALRRSSLPVASLHRSLPRTAFALGGRTNVRCGHCLKNGYSSLERLDRRPKCLAKAQSSSPLIGVRGEDGGVVSDSEFVRQKRERSTFLVRRYQKNNQNVRQMVWPGARAIMRTLLSGHIPKSAWDAVVCEQAHSRRGKKLPETSPGREAALLLIHLQVSKVILSYVGLRFSQVRAVRLSSHPGATYRS